MKTKLLNNETTLSDNETTLSDNETTLSDNESQIKVKNNKTEYISKNEVWNIEEVENKLEKAYVDNSETQLLAVLKDNSFLFYDLFTRKYGVQPIFREINFGNEFRCDFAWLNDNSSGPEWILVEIEKPKMQLFKSDGKPTAPFQAAIEQVKSWDRYFQQSPQEKKKIFGAVSKFRLVLVTGTQEEWQSERGKRWRAYHQSNSKIEIRSMQTFWNSLAAIKNNPEVFWSFKEKPSTLSPKELSKYWKNYGYMDGWRGIDL